MIFEKNCLIIAIFFLLIFMSKKNRRSLRIFHESNKKKLKRNWKNVEQYNRCAVYLLNGEWSCYVVKHTTLPLCFPSEMSP